MMKRKQFSVKETGNFLMRNCVYIICILLLVLPSFFSKTYLSPASLTTLSKNVSVWGLMAIGVSFVMLLGCNDLSIGMIVSMLTVIGVITSNHMGLIPAMVLILVGGVLAGIFNGMIVGKLGMNPFIATLGSQMVFKGVGLVVSGGQPVFSYNKTLAGFYDLELLDLGFITITLPFAVLLIVLAAASFLLKYTKFGQSVYVVGGNKEAAALSGIDTTRVTVICYIISGLCGAITSFFIIALNSAGNGAVGERYSLQTVAACVLGGLAMTGGYGNAFRAFLGVCAMQLIQKVLYQVDASLANLQIGIIGVILVMFLLFNKASIEKNKE